MNSPVDPRFGRARYLVVVDTDTGEFSVRDNSQNAGAVQGAGIQAAKTVADSGAAAVVTGNIGPKAIAALRAAGVKVYLGASGTVNDAIGQFKSDALETADKPNVQGHWA